MSFTKNQILKGNYQTSEFVGPGHPDKICDIIADKILDFFLSNDKDAKVALEILAANDKIFLGGEIKSKSFDKKYGIDKAIVHSVLVEFYGKPEADKYEIIDNINNQSEEINELVTKKNEKLGAGDQGIIIGYATNENDQYLPTSYKISKEILYLLKIVDREGKVFRNDIKSMITTLNQEVKKIVLSIQIYKFAFEDVLTEYEKKLRDLIKETYKVDDNSIIINFFVKGGTFADTGLTGRKIIVDTYGGAMLCGGGALSGKDASKVDRTGAYLARYIAKNIVASGVVDWCKLYLNYEIGHPYPTTLKIESDKNRFTNEKLERIISEIFEFDLSKIIKNFKLDGKVDFETLAKKGHFGNSRYEWEKTNKSKKIMQKFLMVK